MKFYQSSISFVHCFLSFCVGFFIFAISNKCKNPEKIPITIFSKMFSFKLKYEFLKLMRTPFERRNQKFEDDKEKNKQEMEKQEKTDSLASTVEATCESGFQFYFQLSYLLPTILISVALVTGGVRGEEQPGGGGGGGSLTDLFNWRTASIAASFFSISRTFCTIR